MEAVKRLGLVLTIVLTGAACSDDDDTGTGTLDSGVDDATATDGGGSDSGGGNLVDAAALPCTSYTPVSGDKCGGSHCLETEAQLKASAVANANCGGDVEIKAFCSLQAVDAVGMCSLTAFNSSDPSQPAFASAIAACAAPMLPSTFSSACLNCFAESGRCAAANCFNECAADRKTPACDSCRINKGCIGSFYTCAGIPNPLDRL